jgi:hypothetical protein
MKKIILTITVIALTLTVASQTKAAPKNGTTNKVSASKVKSSPNTKITTIKTGLGSQPKLNPAKSTKVKDYHLQFGTKFQQGYFYKGKNHQHWGLIRFDPRYGCDCYWDPCLLVWYYWCDRDDCFYPVSYCPYRCYRCIEVIVQQAREVSPPVAGDASANILPDGPSTEPGILPIPEPVNPR